MAVRERTARRLAWSIGAFSFACAIASLVLLIIDRRAFDSLANADFIDLVIPVGVV